MEIHWHILFECLFLTPFLCYLAEDILAKGLHLRTNICENFTPQCWPVLDLFLHFGQTTHLV